VLFGFRATGALSVRPSPLRALRMRNQIIPDDVSRYRALVSESSRRSGQRGDAKRERSSAGARKRNEGISKSLLRRVPALS